MTSPLISCLVPTKNRHRFIARSLRMFMEQDYFNREMLIIEDGDEDCRDILDSLGYRWGDAWCLGHNLVRYYRHGGTVGEKYKFAIPKCLGEICANWDDDDFYGSDRLTKQYQHMQLTGAKFIGMSSFLCIYEGENQAYEYHGSSWDSCGFTQMYSRAWVMAHPHKSLKCGEDAVISQAARTEGVLSTISHLDILVSSAHAGNTSPRNFSDPHMRQALLRSDNWREVPFGRVEKIIGKYLVAGATA